MNSSKNQAPMPQKKDRFPLSLLCLTIGAFAIGMTEFIIMGLLPNVAARYDSASRAAYYELRTRCRRRRSRAHRDYPPHAAKKIARSAHVYLHCRQRLVSGGSYLLFAYCRANYDGLCSRIIPGRRVAYSSPSRTTREAGGRRIHGTSRNNRGQHYRRTVRNFHWSTAWVESFVRTITLLGILSLIGIIRFIPIIRQDQPSSLAQEFRSLVNPQVLLMLITGALGCASLFSVFTYITPMLESISGFAEHSVTWILVLFGFGVTIGNIVGGKLADWKLMPSVMVNFAVLAVILSLLTVTLRYPVLAVITVFCWGIAAFGIMPGIQVRIMNLAHEAPLLAATSSHSALNLGNASGAYLGGLTITYAGLTSVPWLAAILTILGLAGALLSYGVERKLSQQVLVNNSV